MRNNLVFSGEPETGNESPETTEQIQRKHLRNALKIAQETVDTIRFEMVHRSPAEHRRGKVRYYIFLRTIFVQRIYWGKSLQ
ncbi:hypothetical protein DPMN_172983 [Dreissena polymorpha]|uniref:Uncharacterized protein n=1 Tax=Dreissena polymorpha TaxID=45954 RepID=A0A9D4E3B8_DREPO|nr:hypothetical protein DPMN_172983 [Dreissena polymorpha]